MVVDVSVVRCVKEKGEDAAAVLAPAPLKVVVETAVVWPIKVSVVVDPPAMNCEH